MKPAQRALVIGIDHIETVGGRDRYVKHMLAHQDRMLKIGPTISLEPPKAAFGRGKYRTPGAAGQTGKSAVLQQESFREVREAFRRVREVNGGARKASMADNTPRWQEGLAAKISRNRKLGSKQGFHDESHAAELYHQRRRIQNAASMTERKKNKLDPALYPVVRMRNTRHVSAAELLDHAASCRADFPLRPQSARASTSAAASAASEGARDPPLQIEPPAQQPAGGRARTTATASASAGCGAAGSGSASSAYGPSSARSRGGSGGSTRRPTSAPSSKRGAGSMAGGTPAVAAIGDVSLGKPSSDITVLRRRLLEQIVDCRLFREAELRPFLAAVVRQNKQFDASILKEAVRDVEREFYLL
jgi:hypothetical protein